MSTEPDFELKHLLPVCSAAALFFHVSTLSYELDFLVIRLLFAYIISLSAIWYQLQLPLYHILLMAVTFNATLVLSIVTYRSFFHRIRKFPGPFWAKVTRLWWVSKIRKTNQAYTLTRSLHGKYGDWVRIGE